MDLCPVRATYGASGRVDVAAGLKRGERIALLFFNGSPLAETYFAAVRAGLVATPVNFRLVGQEILYILNDSGAAALFHGPEFVPVVEEVRDRCPALVRSSARAAGPVPWTTRIL